MMVYFNNKKLRLVRTSLRKSWKKRANETQSRKEVHTGWGKQLEMEGGGTGCEVRKGAGVL